jgi:hypothetical protein
VEWSVEGRGVDERKRREVGRSLNEEVVSENVLKRSEV